MLLQEKQLCVKFRNSTDIEKIIELKQKKKQYSKKHEKKNKNKLMQFHNLKL